MFWGSNVLVRGRYVRVVMLGALCPGRYARGVMSGSLCPGRYVRGVLTCYKVPSMGSHLGFSFCLANDWELPVTINNPDWVGSHNEHIPLPFAFASVI